MTDKAHAKLSASGSARWLGCPGSVNMEAGLPNTTSVYAEEGTAAHDLAETCLRLRYDADQLTGEEFNSFTVDDSMTGYVQEYLDYVRQQTGDLLIEQRVDFSPWVPGGFGTADALVLNDGHVYVIDLKYGKTLVDAHENSQLKLYGLGVLNTFGMLYDIRTLTLTIVQPRKDSISEFSITRPDLETWGVRVADAASVALSDDAPLIPGPDQCMWCKAKTFCKARAEHNMNQAFDGFEDVTEPGYLKKPNVLSPEETAVILAHVKDIKRWADDVQSHAQSLLEYGTDVPGFKLVRANAHRKWADEESASKALVRKLKKSVAYTQKLISPAAAEKLLGKDSKILKDHVVKPDGAITVAPTSDKRKAVQCNALEGFDIIDEAA